MSWRTGSRPPTSRTSQSSSWLPTCARSQTSGDISGECWATRSASSTASVSAVLRARDAASRSATRVRRASGPASARRSCGSLHGGSRWRGGRLAGRQVVGGAAAAQDLPLGHRDQAVGDARTARRRPARRRAARRRGRAPRRRPGRAPGRPGRGGRRRPAAARRARTASSTPVEPSGRRAARRAPRPAASSRRPAARRGSAPPGSRAGGPAGTAWSGGSRGRRSWAGRAARRAPSRRT